MRSLHRHSSDCIYQALTMDGHCCLSFAKITVNTNIGDFVTLLGSNIGHDAVVGDYCTISGMCAINGRAVLGKRVFVGGHVVIAPGKKIGDDAYVGNGSVVVTNIRVGYRVFGNPAKKMNL